MAFNPDEYLKQDESTFDPDAYLKLESPSRPEQIRLGAPAKKTEPKPETKPLPRAEKPAGQAGSRKAPEPPMSEGARPLTHEEQVAMTHWAFKNREQAQGLVSLDHVPSRREAAALGLPAGSKEDRAAAWNGAREMATATQPEIPKPDLPTEAKYGPEMETGVVANLPTALREFISEDTYATEQAHYLLASTADVVPAMSRGLAHSAAVIVESGSKINSKIMGEAEGTPMNPVSQKIYDTLIEAADAPWLTWTRKEKEWAAQALAQRSSELGGKVGRVTSEATNVAYDTLQQLAILKGANVKYGGGDGASGRVVNALKIAAFKYLTTEGNPQSDIPISQQKAESYGLTAAYMATTAVSGFFRNPAVAKVADFALNSLISVHGGTYEDAITAAEQSAIERGLPPEDVFFEKMLAAAQVAGMDAIFSAMTTPTTPKAVTATFGKAISARNKAMGDIVTDLQDRRGAMTERYSEAQKTGDKAEMQRAAEDMLAIDAEITRLTPMASQQVDVAPIKRGTGSKPSATVAGAQDREDRKPVAKEPVEALTPEGRAEQEAWVARQVEAQDVVEAPKVEVEAPKVETKPVEIEKPVEAAPKPEEPPPAPKTAPKPVEVKVVSGEGSGRVLKSNFDDIPEDRRATAVTPQEGVRIAGEFRVLDADKLITSEDKGYDQVMQERNRKTAGSREQIEKIAKEGPDFTRLHRNPESDGGAPWVDDLGQVISGNGRVLGIRQAYERGTAADYEKQVRAMAEKMGVDLTGVKRPVLIGEIKDTDGASVLRVAELSNKPAILQMTPAERAKAESKIVNDPDMIRLMDIPESGDLAAASNRKFVMEFIRRTGDDSMRKSDGTPDPSAISRIKQAILASVLATDDAGRDLVRLAIERQTELGVADHITAIVASGGRLMELGRDRPDLDLRPQLASGFRRFMDFKNQKLLGKVKGVEDFIGQKDFLDPISTADALIVKELAKAKSAKQFRSFLDDYVDAAKKVEGANEGMLFGRTEPVTPETLLSKVTGKTGVDDDREADSGRGGKAEKQPGSPGDGAAGGGGVPEAKPAAKPRAKKGKKVAVELPKAAAEAEKPATADDANRPRVDVKTPLSNLSAEKQAKAAQLKKEIAAMKGRMGMGVDPEYLTKGTQLAALYIEGGVKTFEQFATNIKADFGDGWDNIKEYLHAIWSGAGLDARDIDDITRSHAENIIARIDRGEDAPPPLKVAVEGQGISHAQIDKLREVWDMAPRADRDGPTDKDMGEIVRGEYAKDTNVGQKLVNSILGTDRPKVDSIDYAVMVAERVRVEDLLTRAIRDGNEKQASEYTKRLSDIAEAADKSGSESGATLRARQFLKGDDFGDVYVMKRNLEKSQGDKPASPDQVAALTAMKRSYDEAVKERDDARERVRSMQQEVDAAVADRTAATEYRQLVDDAMKRAAAPAKVEGSPAFVSAVRKAAAFLDQDADARIRKLMASTSSVERAIPEAVLAIAEYGAGKLLNGVANWTDLAVKTYGDWVKPHLRQAALLAESIRDEQIKETERVAGEKRKGKKAKPATTEELIGKADTLTKKLRAVYRNIAEMDIAERGEARGFEDATVAVREYMKDVFGLDLTDSEVRVQFSDYGKTRSNVRTEVDLAVMHYRREAQLTESLERLLQGQRIMKEKGLKEFPAEYLPKKSGLVRPKSSDTERDAQKEIHRLMKELKIKTVSPAQQLATWEAATKTRLENSIHDLRMAIESGKPKAGGEKTPNVYTDELMRLSTIEKELRETYKEMFPPSKTPLTEEQRADIAMKAAQRSLQNWEGILNNVKKGDFIKKEKPGAYTNEQIEGVRQARDAIKAEVKRLKDLATPKRTPEEIAVAAKKKRNENVLKELERRIAEKDFSVKDRRHVSLAGDAEGLAAEKKIAEARRELAILKEDARKSQRTMAQIIGEKTLDAVDFVRYVKSTWDMSGLLRQGGPVAVSDFDVWCKALVPVAKAWWSKENSQKDWEQFQTRRNFALYEQAKLGITQGDGKGGFGRIDDIRKSIVADKIPIVERSQRSFATTLNHLRADLFDKLLAGSENSKDVSKEKIQDIARFVNTWTGRGDIGGRLDARTLGAVFWAPKFVKSSFDIATGKAILDGKSMDVKKMATIRYAKALTTLAALYGSYAAIQALNGEEFDVELNPASSLFGAIRIGNYYVNPLGYTRPMLTFLWRLGTGEYKSAAGDRYVMYRGYHPVSSVEKAAKGIGFEGSDGALGKDAFAKRAKAASKRIKKGAPRWGRGSKGIVHDFANTKLHPGISLVSEQLEGRDFVGNDIHRAKSLLRGLIPIVPGTLWDMRKTEDPDALALLAVLAVLGVGPRADYESPAITKAYNSPEEWRRKAYSVMRAGTKPSATKTQRDRTRKYLAEMTPREVILITTKRGMKGGLRSETISALQDKLLTMQAYEKARQKK